MTSLYNACKAAIAHGNQLSEINPARWAETYQTTTEAVREAWESVLTELTRQPQNTYQVEGK